MIHVGTGNFIARGLWAAAILNISVTFWHFLVWWISPFDSIFPTTDSWQVFFVFQAVTLATFAVLYIFNSDEAIPCNIDEKMTAIDLRLPSALAVLGLIFHLIAKQPILAEVNWHCVTALRGAWLSYDKTNDPGWRRILSMSAFILSHFAMPVLFIAAYSLSKQIRNLKSWFFFILSIFVLVLFAFVIVSRMTLLTGVSAGASGSLLALLIKRVNSRQNWFRCSAVILLLALLMGSLSALVAKTRINCTGNEVVTYMNTNIEDAKANWKESHNHDYECEVCLPLMHYLNHGIWNVAQITATEARGGPELFAFVYHYMDRMGIQTNVMSGKRIFSAGGTGLAGASFHDYGRPGTIIVAISLALLWWSSLYFLVSRLTFGLGVTLFPCLFFTMVIQFLFVGPATISFPFTALAFLSLLILPYRRIVV